MNNLDHSSSQFISSLAKGLSVLTAFDSMHPRRTLTEVAVHLGMSRATARRYLLTLLELGYIEQEGRFFFLTLKVLELGYSCVASMPIVDFIMPRLHEITAETGLVSGFAVLTNDEMIFLRDNTVNRFISTGPSLGGVRPAFCSAGGRMILAHLDEHELDRYFDRVDLVAMTEKTVTDASRIRSELKKVRKKGFSTVNGEVDIETCSLAVALEDVSGKIIGALVVVANASLVSTERLEATALPHLRNAATSLKAKIPKVL
jgi:IclR family pca regulon transcriptional regulator